MSFASEVKKELLDYSDLDECCQKAMLFGILINSSEIVLSSTGKKIIVKTTLSGTLKDVKLLLKKFYQIDSEIYYQDEQSLTKRRYYDLEVTDKVEEIIEEMRLMPFVDLSKDNKIISKACCKQAFVRGLFVSKGSVNDPRKERYHFEISSPKEEAINLAKHFLSKKGIAVKTLDRPNRYVLYVKKCDEISKMLAYIGADSGVFYFEDQRIRRDVSNMANRMINCDIANAIKCAKKCDEQMEAIKYIREHDHFNSMPLRLQITAELREEYPDSPYDELSEYSENIFGKPLSKSGISHCFQSLMLYYGDVKRQDEKQAQEKE